jgi:hypothetical protein
VRLTALAAAVIFALLLAEIGLRVLGISYPRWLQNHDLLGSVHRPGVAWRQKDEGNAVIRINSLGLRDRERTLEKPAGTVRIAVLGDSYVEAGQVDEDEMLTQVMERELNACRAFGDRKVEVLNFGVTGYGTAQELLLLDETVWAYSPDIVVIGFLTGNDLRNNTARLRRDAGRPYFVYRDSTLVYDDTFRGRYSALQAVKRDVGHVLLDVSRVVQVIYRVAGQAQKRRAAATRKAEDTGLELGLDDQIYLPPSDPAWQEAWQITEDLLKRIRDNVRQNGAKLLVASLSNAAQVDPDSTRRRATMERIGASTLFYPDDRLQAFCEREGIPVFTLARPLQEFAERNNVVLHGFPGQNLNTGHWNENGHREGGLLLARRIALEFGLAPCPGQNP